MANWIGEYQPPKNRGINVKEFITPEDNRDSVNHPAHYETGKFECFDVMLEVYGQEALKSFCLTNAFKYLYRCTRKNGIEDVKKAQWYLNKLVELSE